MKLCYSSGMEALLALALLLGAPARAAELRDFSDPKSLTPNDHGSWTSYELHKEEGLNVQWVHVEPKMMRNVYRLNADSIGITLHTQKLFLPSPSTQHTELERGDFSYQRAGRLAGGWLAGPKGKGVDMLVVSLSETQPQEFDRADSRAAMAAKKKARTRGDLYAYAESKAKVDAMKGRARLAPLLEGLGLNVNLLRLAGKAKFPNPSRKSALIFAVEGSATVHTGGESADVRGKRVYVVPPGATAHLTAPASKPAYLYLIAISE